MIVLVRSVKLYIHILCFETKLRVGMNNLKYFNLIILRLYWRFAYVVYFSKAISLFFKIIAIRNIAQKLQLIFLIIATVFERKMSNIRDSDMGIMCQ